MMTSRTPDFITLQKYRAATNKSFAQIGKDFGVSRQYISYLYNQAAQGARPTAPMIKDLLPWDIASHPAKARIGRQEPYVGLRAFLRQQLGEELSARSRVSLNGFYRHLREHKVLELSADGLSWVPRRPEDGNLVVRWPKEAEMDGRAEFFQLPPEGTAPALEAC
jgi:transcriptional regulator with XRE-family HTH domain